MDDFENLVGDLRGPGVERAKGLLSVAHRTGRNVGVGRGEVFMV